MAKRVIQFSGGIGSFATALRVAAEHGTQDMVLLFADTKVEDTDLYRFVSDGARHLGLDVTVVCDGRTPWEVFADVRFVGNSRLAPCSSWLKQRPCRRWLEEHADPADTVLYVGVDWSEARRVPAIEKGWAPWRVEFPMCAPPHVTKQDMLAQCRGLGIAPPRLYEEGFPHNNCAGACVRAGQRQWAHLLATHPDRYADAERHEQRLRAELGNVAILRDRSGGRSRPLPLSELRARLERADTARRAA